MCKICLKMQKVIVSVVNDITQNFHRVQSDRLRRGNAFPLELGEFRHSNAGPVHRVSVVGTPFANEFPLEFPVTKKGYR